MHERSCIALSRLTSCSAGYVPVKPFERSAVSVESSMDKKDTSIGNTDIKKGESVAQLAIYEKSMTF